MVLGSKKKQLLFDEIEPLLHKTIHPFVVKFGLKDVLQIMIGASILAIPVGFTEESWRLGTTLPMLNVFGLFLLSLTYISAFVYFHYHHKQKRSYDKEFLKRVLWTYIVSFLTVALILTLILIAPWKTDFILALKRTVIVTFPASMSATFADTIK